MTHRRMIMINGRWGVFMEGIVIMQSDWHIGSAGVDYDKVLRDAIEESNKYTMPGFTVIYTGDDLDDKW